MSTGFSSTSQLPHTGYVYYTELVQDCPPDIRRKIARLVGNKVTLAARVDSHHQSCDGTLGGEFKEEIIKKTESSDNGEVKVMLMDGSWKEVKTPADVEALSTI